MTRYPSSATISERAEWAANAPRHTLDPLFNETAKEVLVGLAHNPNLLERDLLRLLERKDLPPEVLRAIAGRKETEQNQALRLALVRHPRTPRLVSLPILKFLHLFELVLVCLTPAVPTDVKLAAEEAILKRVESIPRGERITLARRSSGRVAAALLATEDRELIRAALDNPFLSEAHLLRLLTLQELPSTVVASIAQHSKWSYRYHLRLALIRHPSTPLPRVLEFLPDLALNDLRDICLDRRMPEHVRRYVLAHCLERLNKRMLDSLTPLR